MSTTVPMSTKANYLFTQSTIYIGSRCPRAPTTDPYARCIVKRIQNPVSQDFNCKSYVKYFLYTSVIQHIVMYVMYESV